MLCVRENQQKFNSIFELVALLGLLLPKGLFGVLFLLQTFYLPKLLGIGI